MKDMIERLIEIDKAAREKDEENELELVNSEKEMRKKEREMRENYLKMAQRRIEINEELAKSTAREKLKKIKERQKMQIETLVKKAHTHENEWVETIVKRVLASSGPDVHLNAPTKQQTHAKSSQAEA